MEEFRSLRNVSADVAKLKQQDGPTLLIQGSSQLIQTLLAHDLIDEFRLLVFPLVLGPGKRLFGQGAAAAALKLVATKVSTTGVIMSTYQRAGDDQHRIFALEHPTKAEIARREKMKNARDNPTRRRAAVCGFSAVAGSGHLKPTNPWPGTGVQGTNPRTRVCRARCARQTFEAYRCPKDRVYRSCDCSRMAVIRGS